MFKINPLHFITNSNQENANTFRNILHPLHTSASDRIQETCIQSIEKCVMAQHFVFLLSEDVSVNGTSLSKFASLFTG